MVYMLPMFTVFFYHCFNQFLLLIFAPPSFLPSFVPSFLLPLSFLHSLVLVSSLALLITRSFVTGFFSILKLLFFFYCSYTREEKNHRKYASEAYIWQWITNLQNVYTNQNMDNNLPFIACSSHKPSFPTAIRTKFVPTVPVIPAK